MDDNNFIMVESKAMPDIFIKTLEVKRLMETGKCRTVQEAALEAGISRSAYYKYKDSVFTLSEHVRGRNLTLAMNLEDTPGLLSRVLNVLAEGRVNILTINQTIPINHIANVTVTLETRSSDISDIMGKLRELSGITALKILARD